MEDVHFRLAPELFNGFGKNLPVFGERAQGGFLVLTHQAGIPPQIRAEDGGQFALKVG